MATPTRIEGDVVFAGEAQFIGGMVLPTGSAAEVGNAEVKTAAAIAASKLEHRHKSAFAEGSDATATTRTVLLLGVVGGNATITKFQAGLHTLMTNGGSDDMQVTFDLQNQAGTTQLAAVITINKSTLYVAKQLNAGTLIASPVLVAGNQLYLVITATGSVGTQAKGVFAQVEINEDAA